MTPVYLVEMYSLCQSNPTIWDFFTNENFCVNKSKIPFVAIGADHGMEQENHNMKVADGIKGLTCDQNVLERLFLVSTILNNVTNEFLSM